MPHTASRALEPPTVGTHATWRAPASYLQQQWYEGSRGQASNYNVLTAWRLNGKLDPAVLHKTMHDLLMRHETLRTCFTGEQGSVEQQIVHDVAPPVWQIDLSTSSAPESDFRDLVLSDVARPFVLTEPPLWRAILARLDTDQHVLGVVLHHSICDGWSSMVLERDLAGLYRAALTGNAAALPTMPIQFADFAAWERSFRHQESEQYWRERLSPSPGRDGLWTALGDKPPFDLICRPIPEVPAAVLRRLTDLARKNDSTLPTLLYAAALMTVTPWLGEEVVFGLAHANRADLDVQPLVGPVFDYLPVSVDLRDAPSLVPLMSRIRHEERAARARLLPLGLVTQAVAPEHAGAPRPVFDLVLNFIPPARPAGGAARRGPGPVFTRYPVATDWSRIRVERPFSGAQPLSFVLRQDQSHTLGGHLYGHGSALGWNGLGRLGRHFRDTLVRLAEDPEHRVAPLEL
ncbi:condensation domain-containing protein [Amycolatopsis thermoflava]|nr:condensation domain-containing protein [Amycolatopsis thermoflava]